MTTATDRYPITARLDDDPFELRPMNDTDGDAVLAFARGLPESDMLFLPRDIARAEHVAEWLEDIERRANVTVLALQHGVIAGYSSVDRNLVGWRRHVGELRVLVSEEYRGRGLGRLLVREAFYLAAVLGVEKMVAHMTPEQEAAMRTFTRFGFTEEAVLHGEVKDREGQRHDLIVMRHEVAALDDIEVELELD